MKRKKIQRASSNFESRGNRAECFSAGLHPFSARGNERPRIRPEHGRNTNSPQEISNVNAYHAVDLALFQGIQMSFDSLLATIPDVKRIPLMTTRVGFSETSREKR